MDKKARPNFFHNAQLFELLVKSILETQGFKISENDVRGDDGFDFVGDLNGEKWAIEVKYYRTKNVRISLIESAAARVVNNGLKQDATKGMLVISSALPKRIKYLFEKKFNIFFVDCSLLRTYAMDDLSLMEDLDRLLGYDCSDVESLASLLVYRDVISTDFFGFNQKLNDGYKTKLDEKGGLLSQKLKKTNPGKKDWAIYEDVCSEILKYLFEDALEGWHQQVNTIDGLSRFDLVCRVRPLSEFWRLIIDHLNSRYVVFEFKNYTTQITQGQILTTEKYLLERALRKVAIIICRKGANNSAITMMQGAMREHGKLILVLDDEMISKMLSMKGNGEDPTDLLFEKTDDFLLSLPR